MSVRAMLDRVRGCRVVGSVLHGAYGDYYEQLVCLRYLKRLRPDLKLLLFFATESRRREMAVFDTSFADAALPAAAIAATPVDRFVQFQVHDRELRDGVIDPLPADVRAKFDVRTNLKPWASLRTVYRAARELCDVPLSDLGRERLPTCMRENGLNESVFRGMTVGFLWRYRGAGDYIRPSMQTPEAVVRQTKSALLNAMVETYGAHVIVAGMNVRVTDENRERTDCKYTEQRLDVPAGSCTYLRGLSWGLELEIMRRCDVCLAMPSGFSEALLMKRDRPTVMVDPPPVYLAKLLFNRMPLFRVADPRYLAFYLRQPHTPERVLQFMRRRGMLPAGRGASSGSGSPAPVVAGGTGAS